MDTNQRERVHAARAEHVREMAWPSRELVSQRAYEIWQRHGCPRNTSLQDWLAAEAEIRCARRRGECMQRHWELPAECERAD